MDNIKYYNDGLAYDFSMFAPKPQDVSRNKDNIVVMPDRNKKYAKRKKAARKAVASPALLIMTAVIALTGLCGSIAMRLKINEVNTQIKDVKAQIAELDSEKTELEVEMQRRISFANLEVEAGNTAEFSFNYNNEFSKTPLRKRIKRKKVITLIIASTAVLIATLCCVLPFIL